MPTGILNAEQLMQQRFVAIIGTDADVDTTTDIKWPNVGAVFDPEGEFRGTRLGKEWFQFSALYALTQRADLGDASARQRHIGSIIVNVFTPLGGGLQRAYDLADTIRSMGDATVSEVIYRTATVTRSPDNNGWHQVNVTVPFQWDGYS